MTEKESEMRISFHKINNLSDLDNFAHRLARRLKGGDIVALSGALGSGKTTLTQLAAAALGVKDKVLSPSFVVFKIYSVKNHSTIKNFCHIDLYRLRDFSRAHGFEEHLGEKGAVCFIEWAERLKRKLPPAAIRIAIRVGKGGGRIIKTSRQI